MALPKSKHSKTLVNSDRVNINKRLYALAVDKYFSMIPNKDERFKKLSKSEERELIEKYKNDRQTLECKLTEHNIFFALNYASTQSYRFNDYDELISLAMNGLRIAATTFDINSGWRFNTWAAFYLKKFILRRFYVKKEHIIDDNVVLRIDSHSVSSIDDWPQDMVYSAIANHVSVDYENNVNSNFIDKIEKNEEEYEIKSIANNVINTVATSSLSVFDKTVFDMVLVNGQSIVTAANELGVSKNEVSSSKKRVISYVLDKVSP